ncbi:MAG: energy-coupling factor transporter transmembrane protein EcfT, partial [Lachnospiraceae bacterium]|nr:energy-coupling factor transporter transmembrane protein EcfT [Lachnospiraceae bacterium]
HSMDPRVKIVLTIAFMVLVFVADSFVGYGMVGGFVIITALISQVPLKMYFKSLRPMLFLIIFTFVLNLLFIKGEEIAFRLGFVTVYWYGIKFSVFMALRLIFMVISASVMTFTTTPVLLSAGIEKLMSPLNAVKFPVHEMSMMMTIALRFIPTLVEETDKIKKAQMARGANFETGGLKQKAVAMIPLLIPLFISAFRRADELAMAMEARCYHGSNGRTSYRVLKMGIIDYTAIAVIIVFGVALIMLG